MHPTMQKYYERLCLMFLVCVCVVCNFTIKHVFPKNKIQNLDVGEHNFAKLLLFNVLFKL